MQTLVKEILNLSTKDKFPFYLKNITTNNTIKVVNISKDGITYYENTYVYRMPFNRFSKDTLIIIKNKLIIKNNNIWND